MQTSSSASAWSILQLLNGPATAVQCQCACEKTATLDSMMLFRPFFFPQITEKRPLFLVAVIN